MKNIIIFLVVLPLILCCDNLTNVNKKNTIESVTYFINNGSVSPDYYSEDYYTIYSTDILTHKQFKANSLIVNKLYILPSNTFNTVQTFINENNITELDNEYIFGGIGCSLRKIIVTYSDKEKIIIMYGFETEAEKFPSELLMLEKMIQEIIEKL